MIELILDKRKRHIGRHGWSIPFLDNMGPVDLPKGLSARDADVLPSAYLDSPPGAMHVFRGGVDGRLPRIRLVTLLRLGRL